MVQRVNDLRMELITARNATGAVFFFKRRVSFLSSFCDCSKSEYQALLNCLMVIAGLARPSVNDPRRPYRRMHNSNRASYHACVAAGSPLCE